METRFCYPFIEIILEKSILQVRLTNLVEGILAFLSLNPVFVWNLQPNGAPAEPM